jgi:hypothetical protein
MSYFFYIFFLFPPTKYRNDTGVWIRSWSHILPSWSRSRTKIDRLRITIAGDEQGWLEKAIVYLEYFSKIGTAGGEDDFVTLKCVNLFIYSVQYLIPVCTGIHVKMGF